MEKDIFLKGQRNLYFLLGLSGVRYNSVLLKGIGIVHPLAIKVLIFLSPLLKVFNVLFACIFVSGRFLGSALGALSTKKSKVPQYDELYLNFNVYFVDRCKASGIFDSSKDWIVGPGFPVSRDLSDKHQVNYQQYLGFSDYVQCYFSSLRTIYHYVIRYSCICLVHKTWEFYVVYFSLLKLAKNSTLYFANQSDKWAAMFDSVPSKKKVLVQHGIAADWGAYPCPLENIDVAYCISKKTSEAMVAHLFANNPELRFMKPTIQLEANEAKNFRVLLVSNGIMFPAEVKIIEYFQDKDVTLFVKKHPHQINDECYRELLKKNRFVYITDRVFPEVDFLISYNSTLVYEYMGYNIPAYIYNSLSDFSLEELVSEISKHEKSYEV